jgi:hypothetical protein
MAEDISEVLDENNSSSLERAALKGVVECIENAIKPTNGPHRFILPSGEVIVGEVADSVYRILTGLRDIARDGLSSAEQVVGESSRDVNNNPTPQGNRPSREEVAEAVEMILLRRAIVKRLDGYTLETSREVADAVIPLFSTQPDHAPGEARKCLGCGEMLGEPHRSECGYSRFLGDTVRIDATRPDDPQPQTEGGAA